MVKNIYSCQFFVDTSETFKPGEKITMFVVEREHFFIFFHSQSASGFLKKFLNAVVET